MKLTKAQKDLLHVISLRPRGAIIRGPAEIKILQSLSTTGAVTNVYEMLGGGLYAQITAAGREALSQS